MHVVCSQETAVAVDSRDDKSMGGGGGGGGGECWGGGGGCVIRKLTMYYLAFSSFVPIIILCKYVT